MLAGMNAVVSRIVAVGAGAALIVGAFGLARIGPAEAAISTRATRRT